MSNCVDKESTIYQQSVTHAGHARLSQVLSTLVTCIETNEQSQILRHITSHNKHFPLFHKLIFDQRNDAALVEQLR